MKTPQELREQEESKMSDEYKGKLICDLETRFLEETEKGGVTAEGGEFSFVAPPHDYYISVTKRGDYIMTRDYSDRSFTNRRDRFVKEQISPKITEYAQEYGWQMVYEEICDRRAREDYGEILLEGKITLKPLKEQKSKNRKANPTKS